jgi:hypothetical protein
MQAAMQSQNHFVHETCKTRPPLHKQLRMHPHQCPSRVHETMAGSAAEGRSQQLSKVEGAHTLVDALEDLQTRTHPHWVPLAKVVMALKEAD